MEIKINKGQIITTTCLAVAGWFAVETYSQAQRISALEEDKTVNSRQDTELHEIRESVQELVILFFQESEDHHVLPTYDNAFPNQGFEATQMDLRSLRKGK